MITSDQIKAKIEELEAYCVANGDPAGDYSGFISALYPATEQYFNSTSTELCENVRDLIFKLYNDLLLRDITYEHKIGPALPTDYPPGYQDLSSIFDGGGALSEILNMSPATFLNGFPITTTTDETTGTSSTVVEINPIIPQWISALGTAHETEISRIQKIVTFCERTGFGQAVISLFEDRGKMTMTKGKTDFAKDIYLDMKVKEVIETFNLDIHVPTYL